MYIYIYIYIYIRFSPQDVHIISVGFCYLPGEKFTARCHPEDFLKFEVFPGKSSSPHRGTEIGCTETSYEQNAYWRKSFLQPLLLRIFEFFLFGGNKKKF